MHLFRFYRAFEAIKKRNFVPNGTIPRGLTLVENQFLLQFKLLRYLSLFARAFHQFS